MSKKSDREAEWEIRQYERGDERLLVELFEKVYGRSLAQEVWRWKLKASANQIENVWLAVDRDGRAIFQIAGIPRRFRLDGTEHSLMLSVDTMTDPRYQRRGLLTRVGQQAYDSWADTGVGLVLGLPNERWGTRTDALGWRSLFPLRWRYLPLRPEPILARRLGIPWPGKVSPLGSVLRGWRRRNRSEPAVTTQRIREAGSELDDLWLGLQAEARINLVRDRRWVQWRYLDHPELDYRVLLAKTDGRPCAYVAYRMANVPAGRIGFVAELTALRADEAARGAVLSAAIEEMCADGAEAVAALAVPSTDLDRLLKRSGFVFRRSAFQIRYVPLDPRLPHAVLRDPNNWDLQGGDFDVV